MAALDKVYNRRPAVEKLFSFSQAVQTDSLVFLAGCVSWDEDAKPLAAGDIRTQIRNVYEDIGKTLAAHGLSFADVVKETVYTLDMEGMAANADVRTPYYEGVGAPASTWVQIGRLVAPEMLLEVEVIAQKRAK